MSSPADDHEILALLDDFPDPGPLPVFDEHGLPAGSSAAAAWSSLLEQIERVVDEDGWDQPAGLYALAGPVQTEALLGDGMQAPELDADGDEVATRGAVVRLAALTGDILENMWGMVAPPWAAALAVVTEAWGVDAHGIDSAEMSTLRPSERPDRFELRQVVLLTRAGELHHHVRSRDPGRVPAGLTVDPKSMLVGVLRRVLSVPGPEYPAPVADYFGRMALTLTRNALADLFGPGHDAASAARAQAVRAAIEEQGEQAEAFQGAVSAVLTRALATVVYRASGKGKDLVPKSSGGLLHRLATTMAPDLDVDQLATLIDSALAVAHVDWEQFASSRGGRAMLPPLVAQNAQWAGPDLVAQWMCDRVLADQDALLANVGEMAGPGSAKHCATLLEVAGWRPLSGGDKQGSYRSA